MNKIIHLSDLHIGSKRINRNFQRIVAKIIETMQPAEDYIIVITGDLIDNGFHDGHHRKCKGFIDLLTDAGFKVLVIPGNHDYGRFGWGVDIDRVKSFKQLYYYNGELSYPKVDFSNDGGIAFIGLDSMAAAFRADGYSSSAAGRIGESQLSGLEEKLNDNTILACRKRVIYLHHHPLHGLYDGHKLKDAEAFCRILLEYRDVVDALLFGHNHYGTEWNGWLEGITRCYDGGASTHKRVKPNGIALHRVIDLSKPVESDYDGKFL